MQSESDVPWESFLRDADHPSNEIGPETRRMDQGANEFSSDEESRPNHASEEQGGVSRLVSSDPDLAEIWQKLYNAKCKLNGDGESHDIEILDDFPMHQQYETPDAAGKMIPYPLNTVGAIHIVLGTKSRESLNRARQQKAGFFTCFENSVRTSCVRQVDNSSASWRLSFNSVFTGKYMEVTPKGSGAIGAADPRYLHALQSSLGQKGKTRKEPERTVVWIYRRAFKCTDKTSPLGEGGEGSEGGGRGNREGNEEGIQEETEEGTTPKSEHAAKFTLEEEIWCGVVRVKQAVQRSGAGVVVQRAKSRCRPGGAPDGGDFGDFGGMRRQRMSSESSDGEFGDFGRSVWRFRTESSEILDGDFCSSCTGLYQGTQERGGQRGRKQGR
jgi:hypothetical protein